jgi:hypothetical protein
MLLVINSLKPNNSFGQNHANPEEDLESIEEKKKECGQQQVKSSDTIYATMKGVRSPMVLKGP